MFKAGNGVFVIRGEIATLMTAMRRTTRWSSHSYQEDEQDPLVKSFQELKDNLNKLDDLKQLEPLVFLTPFLDTIKSEDTTGSVTSLALSAVNKFLCYGLIDHTQPYIALTVHSIADAINHARFISSDLSSDSVVLLKILQVLRTITLAPEGSYLTNESLCEIMLSCFKICFEAKLHELLRRTAEHYLKDIVQLVFMRLPQFSDSVYEHSKQLKMRAGSLESAKSSRKKSRSSFRQKIKPETPKPTTIDSKSIEDTSMKPLPIALVSSDNTSNIVDMQSSIAQISNSTSITTATTPTTEQYTTNDLASNQLPPASEFPLPQPSGDPEQPAEPITPESPPQQTKTTVIDYVNPRGIRFVSQSIAQSSSSGDEQAILRPYGIASVRELLRFLVSLCNPHDRQNTEVMISLGLMLLKVAFEVGADSIGRYDSLMSLVKDDMCRCLFSLLTTERLSIFASTQQVCLLLFESQRSHLKFQLQHYLCRLLEIVAPDSVSGSATVNVSANPPSSVALSSNSSGTGSGGTGGIKVSYEHREIALDTILQLWRIPGFVTELYLNYDCHIYCPNLFEELGKLLAKNAFPAAQGVFGTHLLSLDALLSVVEEIGQRCHIAVEEVNDEKQQDDSDKEVSLKVSLRRQLSGQVPSRNDLTALKNIKRWLPTGTEYFNQKAKKGIQFLQEHEVLQTPLNPEEIVDFFRENPDLDKKQIGDYISGRNNNQVLHAFVNLFDFHDTRIDDALRMFLETFRLPGEAPLISLLLETFAAHWHKSNGAPFADEDAAFTLAYAIIILNVDQHNHNVRKQSQPMTAEGFKKNLTKVNGGSDFEQDMLDEVYNAIKNEEIVMPAEHTGIVRDNYLWKVLLRRGASITEGKYVRVLGGRYDRDLFALIWAPTVSALSHVLDRAEEATVWRRALHGFERCAHISACYGNTANLDMVIATISKYTQLQQHHHSSTINGGPPHMRVSSSCSNIQLYIQLGGAPKAQLALRTMFTLVRQYGDGLRLEGWRQVMDAVLALFTADALPRIYCEAEDFIEPSGKVALEYEHREVQKQDTGLLSSLYSYMVSSENIAKVPTPEEQELIDVAKACIKDCNLEQVITESKFLHVDALVALINTLIELSKGPDVQKNLGYAYNESVTIFFLELLVKIVLQNRDRVMCVWQSVRDHLYMLPMNACLFDYPHLLQRSVVGLLRLAVRLMRNEEMSGAVLQSLHMLLLLKTNILYRISTQIAYGLYELLKTSAQNIHTSKDWALVFTLLECVGAGAQPPRPITDETQLDSGTRSDGELDLASSPPSSSHIQPHQTGSSGNLHGISATGLSATLDVDRGYTSDSELTKSPRHQQPPLLMHQQQLQHHQHPVQLVQSVSINATTLMSPSMSSHNSGWILVGSEGEVQQVVGRTPPANQYGLDLERSLGAHDPYALLKCCDSLAFLVRDVAHITPYNFDDCIHCIRTFVEATLQKIKESKRTVNVVGRARRKGSSGRRRNDIRSGQRSPTSSPEEDDESEEEDELPSGYRTVTTQLLHVMHTLHTRTAQIFKWWAEESASKFDTEHKQISLWTQGWCPLLQGIARLCCDHRKQDRFQAIVYLQRSLLVHDLQTLTGPEWEACFHRVLFPLLSHLLQPLGTSKDIASMEETRMRAATILSKVFLHHLTPLLTLPTFSSLWLIILDFMDKYMHADGSDLLAEAIPESLKNMLLVMESAEVFTHDPNLWPLTWQRIDRFLPGLRNELFQPPQQKSGEEGGNEGEMEGGTEETHQSTPEDTVLPVVQHNIENATRSSIILQPPSSQHGMMNSTLFAHLGQMVSTPIGPSNPTPIIYPPPKYPKSLTSIPKAIPTPIPVSLPAHLLTSINSIPSPPLQNHKHRTTSPVSPVRNLPMPPLPTHPLTTSLMSTHPPLAPIVTPLPLPASVTIAPPRPVHIPNATSSAPPAAMIPHTFPVLYADSPPAGPAPPILTQLPINNNVERKMEGTGSSIYSDYLDNPYNMAAVQSTYGVNNNGGVSDLTATDTAAAVSSDMLKTSHYFGGTNSENGGDLFHTCLVGGGQDTNNIPFTYEAADVNNSNSSKHAL